jgi:hypothetical protein
LAVVIMQLSKMNFKTLNRVTSSSEIESVKQEASQYLTNGASCKETLKGVTLDTLEKIPITKIQRYVQSTDTYVDTRVIIADSFENSNLGPKLRISGLDIQVDQTAIPGDGDRNVPVNLIMQFERKSGNLISPIAKKVKLSVNIAAAGEIDTCFSVFGGGGSGGGGAAIDLAELKKEICESIGGEASFDSEGIYSCALKNLKIDGDITLKGSIKGGSLVLGDYSAEFEEPADEPASD